MIIATWNLHYNNKSNCWARLQTALGTDILFLQESHQPKWDGERMVWEAIPDHEWGSAVLASKGNIRPIEIDDYKGWVVGGEWCNSGFNSADRPLYVFSVHAPTTRPRSSYVEKVIKIPYKIKKIKAQVPEQAELIIGGDFNFLSLGERIKDEQPKTTQEERDALTHFEKMGLISCWAEAHRGQAMTQTLRWNRDKTIPYHCDGIFVPRSWEPRVFCEVLTSKIFEVSDHNPVVAWISE